MILFKIRFQPMNLIRESKLSLMVELFLSQKNLILNKQYYKQKNFQRQVMRKQSTYLGPLMCIKNNTEKGLKVTWNFGGLITQNDFNCFHLFVFLNVRNTQALQLINLYYEKMKLGDLLGIFPKTTFKNDKQKIKWTQKTSFELQSQFVNSNYLLDLFDMTVLKALVDYVSKLNGLIIVNIVINQNKNELKHRLAQLEKDIVSLRSVDTSSDKLVINILSEFQQPIIINCLTGVNLFKYEKFLMRHAIEQIINYIKVIAIKKIKIHLQILGNIQCKLVNSLQWKLSETSSIEKTYFGIPSCRFDEHLIFLLDEQSAQQLTIVVTMQTLFFNSQQIRSKNELTFQINPELIKSNTIIPTRSAMGGTTLINNKYVESNLSERSSYFWLFISTNNI